MFKLLEKFRLFFYLLKFWNLDPDEESDPNPVKNPHSWFLLILDGNSEISAHGWSDLGYLSYHIININTMVGR